MPGDIVALYTDGVTEAENDKSEMFGTERLVELVKANRGLPMQEVRKRIVAAVTEFRSPEKQPDDLTLVLIKAE
jgi:sigma-B regulation protein RsbU (phosphoserine phosphatase)